jgi:hypothetical protein
MIPCGCSRLASRKLASHKTVFVCVISHLTCGRMYTYISPNTKQNKKTGTVRSSSQVNASEGVRLTGAGKSIKVAVEEDDAHGAWDHGGFHLLTEADITRNPL